MITQHFHLWQVKFWRKYCKKKLKWESQQIASFNGKVDRYRLTPSVRIIWEAVPTRPPIQTLLLSPMHNSALTLTCLRSQLWSRPKQTRVMLMFWQHLTLTFHLNVNMYLWNKINSFLVAKMWIDRAMFKDMFHGNLSFY